MKTRHDHLYLYNVCLIVFSADVEESLVIFVLNIKLCPIFNQKVDNTRVPLLCGNHQRCEAVHVTQLWVSLPAAKW